MFNALDLATWFKRALKIMLLFGVYTYLVSRLRDERQLVGFLRASFLVCMLIGSMEIVQRLQNLYEGLTFEAMQWPGVAGTFANSNEGASYIAIFLIFAASLYASRIHERVMSQRLFISSVCLIVLGLVLAMSRTGLMAAVGVTALLFGRDRRLRPVLICGSLPSRWPLPFRSPRFWFNRILGIFGLSGNPEFDLYIRSDLLERVYLWSVYWEIIKAYPVFGIGAANYGFLDRLRLDWPSPPIGTIHSLAEVQFVASSHNGFLSWWAEAGTVAWWPLWVRLIYAAMALRRLLRSQALSTWQKAIGLGTYGGLWVFALTNFAESEFGVSELRYWMLLAFASAVLRQSAEPLPSCAELPPSEYRQGERSEHGSEIG